MSSQLDSSEITSMQNALKSIRKCLPEHIQLIAVSKRQHSNTLKEAIRMGQIDFGENTLQEALPKIETLMDCTTIRWHFIGHVQRNKIDKIVRHFHCIHSVDSERLLNAIQKSCTKLHKTMPIFLQINISEEPQKFGIAPNNLFPLLRLGLSCSNIQVIGLMGISRQGIHNAEIRKQFSSLRLLRDQAQKQFNIHLKLSMGMSSDWEIAIEEQATHIRLGTAIFNCNLKK